MNEIESLSEMGKRIERAFKEQSFAAHLQDQVGQVLSIGVARFQNPPVLGAFYPEKPSDLDGLPESGISLYAIEENKMYCLKAFQVHHSNDPHLDFEAS